MFKRGWLLLCADVLLCCVIRCLLVIVCRLPVVDGDRGSLSAVSM